MTSWPDPLPGDWCWSHGRSEPIDDDTYRVCGECFHAFPTEADLIREHNAVLAELDQQYPESAVHRAPRPDVTSGEEIWSCPHCIHDF